MDKYLYEIIEEYKDTDSVDEKDEIFHCFCSSIWSSKNKRRIYTKAIKFNVKNDLLDTELGKIFDRWSAVEYVGYKSMSNDTDWCSLIRQKINNLYTRYFDKEVILNKDYMNLLKTPYNLYYRWIKGFEIEMNIDELDVSIVDSIRKAEELKIIYQKQKMDLSWSEYKNVVEGFLRKIFDNCKLVDDYESANATNKYIYDFTTEDNFYIRYVCRCLDGEMLKWQKQYYKIKDHKKYKHCKNCGALIEKYHNKVQYCNDCKRKMELERYRKYNKKRSNHN